MIAADTCAADNDKELDRLWGECKTAVSGAMAEFISQSAFCAHAKTHQTHTFTSAWPFPACVRFFVLVAFPTGKLQEAGLDKLQQRVKAAFDFSQVAPRIGID